MTNTPFKPFEANVDREIALQVLRDAVAGADDGELFFGTPPVRGIGVRRWSPKNRQL